MIVVGSGTRLVGGIAVACLLSACGRYSFDPLASDAGAVDAAAAEPDAAIPTIRFQDGVAPDPGYAGTRTTHILQDQPTDNAGTSVVLRVDGSEPASSKFDQHGLIRWDVTALPPGTTVRSAEILFVLIDHSGGEQYDVVEVTRPWVELEATWEQYANGQPWEQAGALGPLDRGDSVLGAFGAIENGTIAVPFAAAGNAVVQQWIDDPAQNHGLLLLGDDNVDGIEIHSRYAAEPSQRPVLVVQYE